MTSKTQLAQLVFVYGSLKEGFHNHDVLSRARKVCDAVTEEKFHMVSLGSFPAVVNDPDHRDSRHVIGEVYMVSASTMDDLDHLEGYPILYDRQMVQLQGMDSLAWMYFYKGDVQQLPHEPSVVNITDETVSWTHEIRAMQA